MSKLPQPDGPPKFEGIELIRRLGVGGMGEVWLARRGTGRTTRPVAVKIMASHLCDSREHLRLFESEIRLSMLLNHSNIVQVFDLCQVGERRGLVMEWVEGVNLEQLLEHLRARQTAVPLDVAVHVLGELLKALAYAHGRGDCTIVHRDISPHNVLLSVSGQVKLADFGVARVSSDSTSGSHIRGKLRYMAPEQASGTSTKESVDIFAVGAIFHELLAGERFRHETPREAMLSAVLAGKVPELRRADVPELLEQLRKDLLQSRVADRVSSASAALGRLRQWSGYRNVGFKVAQLVADAASHEPEQGATTPGASSRVPSAPPGRVMLPRIAAMSLLSLGAGLGLAAAWGRASSTSEVGGDLETDAPASISGPSADQTMAEVTFVTVDQPQVHIMVGNVEIEVAPSAIVELSAGRHEIQLRDGKGRWRLLGELLVEPGEQYRVDLVDNFGAPLSR